MILVPDWIFNDYSDVTPQLLEELGITLLLADLDFTLAPKSVREPDDAVRAWLAELKAAGITVMILSNNRSPRRVRSYCSTLGIDFVGHAQKPARTGYRRAMQRCGASPGETAMLGDKLLTDCLGARRSGILSLAVEPKGGAVGPWQKVLHALQEPFKRASAHDLRQK